MASGKADDDAAETKDDQTAAILEEKKDDETGPPPDHMGGTPPDIAMTGPLPDDDITAPPSDGDGDGPPRMSNDDGAPPLMSDDGGPPAVDSDDKPNGSKGSKNKNEFLYFPSTLSLQPYQVCPICVPDIKFDLSTYSTEMTFPRGITMDPRTGCISGFVSSSAKIGKAEYLITILSPVDGKTKTGKLSIEIRSTGIPRPIWIDPGNIHFIKVGVGQNLNKNPYKICMEKEKGSRYEKFEYQQCGPYDVPLIDGIEFDRKKGKFGGSPTESGKCSFRITVTLKDGSEVTSPPFVIEVSATAQNVGDQQELLTVSQIQSLGGQVSSISVENVYELCCSDNGLNVDNLKRALLLMKKAVSDREIAQKFDTYNEAGFVSLEKFKAMLETEKFPNISFDTFKGCFTELFGETTKRDAFELLMTTRGDVLNEDSLKATYQIADPNGSGILNVDALQKLL